MEQGNRSMYDYICQFNMLAQYGSYHVDTDEKKANLFRNGLMVQLQDCLNMFPNLSYNELASAAIDKEGSMNAYTKAEEKKRKKVMSGSSRSGGSSGAPPKYRMVYTPPTGQLRVLNSNTGAIAHSTNNGSSSHSSSSTTVLQPHNCSNRQLVMCSKFKF
jgi:hypothetical protein